MPRPPILCPQISPRSMPSRLRARAQRRDKGLREALNLKTARHASPSAMAAVAIPSADTARGPATAPPAPPPPAPPLRDRAHAVQACTRPTASASPAAQRRIGNPSTGRPSARPSGASPSAFAASVARCVTPSGPPARASASCKRRQRHPRPEPEARDDHRTTLHCRIGSAALQPRLRPMAAGFGQLDPQQIAAMPGRPVQHQRLGFQRHRIQDQAACPAGMISHSAASSASDAPPPTKTASGSGQARQPLRRARLGHPVAMRQPEGLDIAAAPARPGPGRPPAPRPARPRPAAIRSRWTPSPRRCPTAFRPGAGPAPTASAPGPGAW